MLGIFSQSKLISAEVEAVKILADGTRVPLGTVAYWHRNPFKRIAFHLKQIFKGA